MLLWCHKNSTTFKTLFPKRLAFSGHDKTGPDPDEERLNEALIDIDAAKQERLDMLYGNSDHLEVADTQIGVRGEIAATYGHDLGKRILEARMHKRLRDFVEHGDKKVSEHSTHASEHHKIANKGLVSEKATKAGHSIVKAKSGVLSQGLVDFFVNPFKKLFNKPTRSSNIFISGDMVDARVENEFGLSRSVEEMKEHLKSGIMDRILKVAQNKDATVGSKIIEALTGTTPSTSPSPDDIWKELKKATFTQLKKLEEVSYSDGGHEHSLFRDHHWKNQYAFDKLLGIRKIEVEERAKIMSKERYDVPRLEAFMNALRTGKIPGTSINFGSIDDPNDKSTPPKKINLGQRVYDFLFARIFNNKDAMYRLERNPDNLALVLELEHIFLTCDADKDEAAKKLFSKLEKIYGKLPSSAEKAKEGHEDPESVKLKKEIEEQEKVLFGENELQELLSAYAEAPLVNENFASAEKVYQTAKEKAEEVPTVQPTSQTVATSNAAKSEIQKNYREAEAQLKAARKEKADLLKKVQGLEGKFKRAAGKITTIFNSDKCTTKIDKGIEAKPEVPATGTTPAIPAVAAVPTKDPELVALQDLAGKPLTTVDELFPPITAPATGTAAPTGSASTTPAKTALPTSNFITFFQTTFTEATQANLKKEIKKHKDYLNPKGKATPRQLLYLLKKDDFETHPKSITNPELNDRYALLATNLAIADARSAGIHAAANNELAEANMSGLRGFLHRKVMWIKKQSFKSEVYTAQQVIETVAQGDLEHFRHLTKHSSVADVRKILNKHPMEPDKLRAFALGLEKVLRYHVIKDEGHDRTIEIYDFDWDVEDLVQVVRTAEAELIARTSIYAAENPTTDDEKKKTLGTRVLEQVKTQADLEKKQEVDIEKLTYEHLETLSPHYLEHHQKQKLIEEYEKAKKEGLKGEGWLAHLSKLKLTNAWKLFGAALAAKETYDMGMGLWNGAKRIFGGKKKAPELPAHPSTPAEGNHEAPAGAHKEEHKPGHE